MDKLVVEGLVTRIILSLNYIRCCDDRRRLAIRKIASDGDILKHANCRKSSTNQ